MANVKVRGIILRMTNFKDYDKYLSILTRDLGIISVFAKGIRRPKNRFNSSCQLFSFNDFELFYNKGRYSLNEASNVTVFKKLHSDIYLLTAASQIAEIILDNGQDIEASPRMYELIVRSFYELERGEKDAKTTTLAAMLKLTSYLGYKPLLDSCFECDNVFLHDEFVYFDFRSASLYCSKHVIKVRDDYNTNIRQISPALLQALRYISDSSLEKTFSFTLNETLQDEMKAFTNLYLIERYEKSYDKISKLDMFQ